MTGHADNFGDNKELSCHLEDRRALQVAHPLPPPWIHKAGGFHVPKNQTPSSVIHQAFGNGSSTSWDTALQTTQGTKFF